MVARLLGVFCLGACALALAPAQADVYVYHDEAGVAHYTNVPMHDRYQRIVAVLRADGARNQAGAKPFPEGVSRYSESIERAARAVNIDSALVHAVITVESAYNARAVSRAGAQGLMQLMPATARRYGVRDSFDPEQNLLGGTRYLRDLLDRFNNDLTLVLAAYNAGEHAVMRYGGKIPPFRETRAYVPRVMNYYARYQGMM